MVLHAYAPSELIGRDSDGCLSRADLEVVRWRGEDSCPAVAFDIKVWRATDEVMLGMKSQVEERSGSRDHARTIGRLSVR